MAVTKNQWSSLMKRTFKHMAMWTWPESVYNENPQRMVRRLREAHVDIIIPYTCGQRGEVHREGKHTDPARYDECLRLIIEEAHRYGLKVQACFDELNAYPDMPVFDLQQIREDGSKAGILCPANPDVVDYVLARLRRSLTEFDYDGINLEDGYVFNGNTIYDPAHQAGEKFRVIPVCYCDYCRKNAPLGKPSWPVWKQEQLTALIAKEAELIRAFKPDLPFSVAARMPYDRSFYEPYRKEIPYYDGWRLCQSRDGLSADWAEWLRRGYIDFVCPMSYFHSARLVELETGECRQLVPEANSKIWMGLGLGEYTVEYLQGIGEGTDIERAGDATLQNGAQNIETLLREQLRMGQENVVFFCYQYLLDEHLPVLARFRGTARESKIHVQNNTP